MGIADVMDANAEVFARLVAHAGEGHDLLIDMLNEGFDITENEEDAVTVQITCMKHQETICEIDGPS